MWLVHLVHVIKVEELEEGESNKFYSQKFADIVLKKYAPYAPLWTNIIGIFVDKSRTRISNSPAEGYFNIRKNHTLECKRNVRPGDYIRASAIYNQAKIKEIEEIIINHKDIEPSESQSQIIKLDEEMWKRTPRHAKVKMTREMELQRSLEQFKKLTRDAPTDRYIFLKFQDIHSRVGSNIIELPVIDLHEFQNLTEKKELFSSVIDCFIEVMIYELEKNAYSTCCERGKFFFLNGTCETIDLPLQTYHHIFIPIQEPGHYTLVHIDTQEKTFSYLNSFGENMRRVNKFFNIFQRKCSANEYKLKLISHSTQADAYNCGVY